MLVLSFVFTEVSPMVQKSAVKILGSDGIYHWRLKVSLFPLFSSVDEVASILTRIVESQDLGWEPCGNLLGGC